MGEFEAIGDAVTGGLLARAVEPRAGEAADKGHTQEKNCLNCGAQLTGPYCAICGQKAHVHRSLRGFLQDFASGMLNFEGKFWRTLPMLALRPGEMTRRYIAGERARFISPVALYLFTVFVMFAVLNLDGAFGAAPKSIRDSIQMEITQNQAKIQTLEARRKVALTAGKDVSDLDRRITKRKQDIADSRKVLSGEVLETDELKDVPIWLRPVIENVRRDPAQTSQNIQEAASRYSWLLIPISVPFLWLLFPLRRRYNLYDHTVFVTYSLSFMMLLVIAGSLLVAAGWSAAAGMLFLIPPFHMYRQLKGAYELGRLSAIVRTMALVTFSFIAGALFFSVAVAIGAT